MRHRIKKIGIILMILMGLTILIIPGMNYAVRMSEQEKKEQIPSYSRILEISNVTEYMEFAKSVSSGETFEGCKVFLTSDLDFSENSCGIMIGNENAVFSGTFDGNGHKISGLIIENSDGYSGMFAVLCGSVKNLQMENCKFRGTTAGAVAAVCKDGAILNCCIDASVNGEVSGSVVGVLRGNLRNCVFSWYTPAGEVQKGELDNCFTFEEMDVNYLNANLPHISGSYTDTEFLLWSENSERIFVKSADLVESLTARLTLNNKELKLKAYYSENEKAWCFVLPSGCKEAQISIETVTSKGNYEQFTKKYKEESYSYIWENLEYPLKFICAENMDTLFVSLEDNKDLYYVHAHKEEEISGVLTIIDAQGEMNDEIIKGFYGHGNDSWLVDKKSYNLKLDSESNLLDMGLDEDYSLLACYRDNSLMCYATTMELCKEIGFSFMPEYRFVNLYVSGEYVGIYYLAEKMEIDENRIDIAGIYEETKTLNHNYMEGFSMEEWKDENSSAARYYYNVENDPEDLSGGYLLEADIVDYEPTESRFVSERGIPMTMKRARYSSEAQVNYIADYWQEFEDALFAEDGNNALGKHYTEYIDLESFALQWLIYELVQEASMSSSIYYYKESDQSGDGLLHACYPWDMEHSYIKSEKLDQIWNITEKAGTLYGYWAAFEKHEDFKQELRRVWNEKFVPAIEIMTAEEAIVTADGMKNLRWFEENIELVCCLESSRWKKMDPLKRCEVNREFLKYRKEVIDAWLAE